jgi:hypothetical protein
MNKPRDTYPNSANQWMVWSEKVGVEATLYDKQLAVDTLKAMRDNRRGMSDEYWPWLYASEYDEDEMCEVWNLQKGIV